MNVYDNCGMPYFNKQMASICDNTGSFYSKCGGEKNGTCAAVRLIEGVCLIWGPLNTGLTVHESQNT